MKKKILSQLMILSFAFAGLFFSGDNVFAKSRPVGGAEGGGSNTEEHSADDTEQGGQGNTVCSQGGPGSSACSVTWTVGFLGFTFSGGCSTVCNQGFYACCNTDTNSCDCIEI